MCAGLIIALYSSAYPLNPALAQDSLHLDEADLVTPSAQDILRQLEGSAPAPSPKVKAKSQPSNKPQRIEVEDKLTLIFLENALTLSDAIKADISSYVIAHSFEEHERYKIISYAHDSVDSDVASLRQKALQRALIIQNFLQEHDISTQRIDIFPMATHEEKAVKNYVEIYVD